MATRIKAARLIRGFSQAELARRIHEDGHSYRLVGALERGKTAPRPGHIRALAAALECGERWFTEPFEDLCHEPPEPALAERLDRIEAILRDAP